MTIARKLEQLVRIIPGGAGYLDKEAVREKDKAVRVRLADEIKELQKGMEEHTRRLTETRDLSLIPEIERLASTMDRIRNAIQYAARGYHGFFDTHPIEQTTLDRLLAFDQGLQKGIGGLKAHAVILLESHHDPAILLNEIQSFQKSLEQFERTFSKRREILS